jgi:hypothetical protein
MVIKIGPVDSTKSFHCLYREVKYLRVKVIYQSCVAVMAATSFLGAHRLLP